MPIGGSGGISGVQIGYDIDPLPPTPGWIGICIRTLNGSGAITSVEALKIYWEDTDPDAPGYQVRAGTCGEPSGNCNATVLTTGIETVAPSQATKTCNPTLPGTGICAGKLVLYNNGNPSQVINYPGVTVQLDPRIGGSCPFGLPACVYAVVRLWDLNGSMTQHVLPPI